jgi:uncharacterized protein YndB with AHSA1/START domain/effector-binding domain-containing protein
MTTTGKLRVTTPSEREIALIRDFDAPRRLVFDALTRPELLKRWFFGPDGWSLVVCEIDLRVGGEFRYVWRHDANGHEMGMGGVYHEIVAPERIVATERFEQSWYPGEAVGTFVLVERGGRTTLTTTMRYESREARDAVLKTPMEQGVAAGYDRLEGMLASLEGGPKIDTPSIVRTDAQRTAVVHLTVPRAEIQQVMGPAITEVMQAIGAQGIAPAGPVFSYHSKMDPNIFDFEVGVPVSAPVAATGRVKASQLLAATVARTVYHGPYEGLGAAWATLMEWIAANGHRPAPDLWERYVTGPESSPDPGAWRTELNRPLVAR